VGIRDYLRLLDRQDRGEFTGASGKARCAGTLVTGDPANAAEPLQIVEPT
jgi:hypothetical protein